MIFLMRFEFSKRIELFTFFSFKAVFKRRSTLQQAVGTILRTISVKNITIYGEKYFQIQ